MANHVWLIFEKRGSMGGLCVQGFRWWIFGSPAGRCRQPLGELVESSSLSLSVVQTSNLENSLLFDYRELQNRVLVWLVSSEEWEGCVTSFELHEKQAGRWVKSDQWVCGSCPFLGLEWWFEGFNTTTPWMVRASNLRTSKSLIINAASPSDPSHRISAESAQIFKDEHYCQRLRHIQVLSNTTPKHQKVSVASH